MERPDNNLEEVSRRLSQLQSQFGRQAVERAFAELPSPESPTEDSLFTIEPYDDNHVLITSKETGVQNFVSTKPLQFKL